MESKNNISLRESHLMSRGLATSGIVTIKLGGTEQGTKVHWSKVSKFLSNFIALKWKLQQNYENKVVTKSIWPFNCSEII